MHILVHIPAHKAILAGCGQAGWRIAEVDPSRLSPEERDVLACKICTDKSRWDKDIPTQLRNLTDVCLPPGRICGDVLTPTHDDVVRVIREELAKEAQDKIEAEQRRQAAAEAHEAEVARVLSCPLEDLINPKYWSDAYDHPAIVQSGPWSDPRTKARLAEAEAEVARINAAHKAAKQAEREAVEAAKEAKREEFRKWVRENGSQLAKLRLEEGYDSWISTARDEYATAVAKQVLKSSGAGLYVVPDKIPGRVTKSVTLRTSPTVEEIIALRKVRETLRPGDVAELVWVFYKATDRNMTDITRAEIRLTIQIPSVEPAEVFLGLISKTAPEPEEDEA